MTERRAGGHDTRGDPPLTGEEDEEEESEAVMSVLVQVESAERTAEVIEERKD